MLQTFKLDVDDWERMDSTAGKDPLSVRQTLKDISALTKRSPDNPVSIQG